MVRIGQNNLKRISKLDINIIVQLHNNLNILEMMVLNLNGESRMKNNKVNLQLEKNGMSYLMKSKTIGKENHRFVQNIQNLIMMMFAKYQM